MTVKELIAELEKYPEDLEVWDILSWCTIDEVEERIIDDCGQPKSVVALS